MDTKSSRSPSDVPTTLTDPTSSKDDTKYTEWDLGKDGDKFKFAPPTPDRDPWSILLEPILEKDRAQCETWKDEVNNVLFFATLFSAVVTAFVVDSYKTLRPDPQDTVIMLLSQIAISLNGTSAGNPDAALLTPPSQPTSGRDPAVRINSIWFMSLVLSLTTVLFGIISLQWIREYQAYSELTPKQTFAVFQMRSEGLQKWYLPKVFTALPVLLQFAVVLFLVGMVDFSLLLGPGVSIPTLVSIGVTLLFYVATTVLPTVQGLSLYVPFMHSSRPLSAPAQCPYKSPQSRAFRIVFHFTFYVAHYLYLHVIEPIQNVVSRRIFRRTQHPEADPIIPLLSSTWKVRTWQQFDLAWLSLRDAYALQTFNRQGLVDHFKVKFDNLFPVFDITLGLRSLFSETAVRDQDGYLAAAYHAFCGISRSVTDHSVNLRNEIMGTENTGVHHQYFLALINNRLAQYPTLPGYLGLHPERVLDTPNFIDVDAMLVHHEHIILFFINALDTHAHLDEFESFRIHLVEVQIRAMKYIYKKHSGVSSWSSTPLLKDMPLSTPISVCGAASFHTRDDDILKGREIWWQYSNIYRDFFEKVGSIPQPKDWTFDLHAGMQIPSFINQIQIELNFLRDLPHNKELNSMADDTLEIILTVIQDRLSAFLDLPPDQAPTNTNLLFYTASMFLRRYDFFRTHYPRNHQNLPKGVDECIELLGRYKSRVLDKSGPDRLLEERFAGVEKYDGVARFCPTWWKFLGKSRLYNATEGHSLFSLEKADATSGKEVYEVGGGGSPV